MRNSLRAGMYVLWHFVVSLEFIVLVGMSISYRYLSVVRNICSALVDDAETVRWLALLPIGVAVWLFAETRKILWPDVENRAVLLKWPGYLRLKCCCGVALLYAAISSLMAISAVCLFKPGANGLPMFMLLASTAVVFVDAATCWVASLTVVQVLEGCSPSSDK